MTRMMVTYCGAVAMLTVGTVMAEHEPVTTEVIVTGLQSPIELVPFPADPTVMIVNEKSGRARIIRNGQLLSQPFLDITDRVFTGSEKGFLGIAFPTAYPADPSFYVHYSRSPGGSTAVSRLQHVAGDPYRGDPASEEIIFSLSQNAFNHNGGHIEFGPDGMLFVALGDDASSSNGQNIDTHKGSILRLDVSGGPGSGYSIPPDNPFVGKAGLGEIWAFGLRNPWNFSFDVGPGATHGILIADVGAGSREEIDFGPPGVGGRNYAWNCFEGNAPGTGCAAPPGLPFVQPIHDYSHGEGNCVIGGYVYRGPSMACNRGRYFYGDLSGRVWSFRLENGQAQGNLLHFNFPFLISSLGRDAQGELYVLDYSAGRVLRIAGTGVDGDGNGDSGVDLSDFAIFDECANGVGDPADCACFDFDGDLDVDMADFRHFQIFFDVP